MKNYRAPLRQANHYEKKRIERLTEKFVHELRQAEYWALHEDWDAAKRCLARARQLQNDIDKAKEEA